MNRLDIPTQWGIYFSLDYNQEVYFHTKVTVGCALPCRRHRKLWPDNADVAVSAPSREIVE